MAGDWGGAFGTPPSGLDLRADYRARPGEGMRPLPRDLPSRADANVPETRRVAGHLCLLAQRKTGLGVELTTMTYEVTGRIARITFNRPEKGNAIIAATPVELPPAWSAPTSTQRST